MLRPIISRPAVRLIGTSQSRQIATSSVVPIGTTLPTGYFKRNNKGIPFNGISEWIDEGVDIGFLDARTTIRSQQFKKQPRKNAVNRLGQLTIVDNSKYGVSQHLTQPKMVISYRSQRRYALGSVGDVMLISVGAEFKRALFVGQTKYNQTFRPYFEQNNVIVFSEDGSPAGTRILAPLPSYFRDPKQIKKMEQIAKRVNLDLQMSKIIAICPQFI